MGKTIRIGFWRVTARDIPRDDRCVAWLYDQWRRLDRWIDSRQARHQAKSRDAYIRLDQSGSKTTRTDLDFVPLINVRLQWMFVPGWSMLLEADWLAASQGRAEDIMAAVQYHLRDRVVFRVGYRILEGGAKNSRVLTFSLFHYVVFGTTVLF